MSSKISILDNGPACEPEKFIVEIVGNQHPNTQKLVICDEAGEPLRSVSAAEKEEARNEEEFASLLKIWNWDDMPGKSLSLEVASESGKPIRLPLLAGRLRPTPRQEEAQLNQIVPIVPCTALPGIQNPSDQGAPVVVRSGYIYVFYHSKLWRELEVRFTDNGTRFHDVDVASYRAGKRFKTGKREPSGVGLEDIWLPSQWNGHPSLPVQMMFSEVQLSAARLAHMESHESRLEQRTRGPRLLISESSLRERWADSPDGLSMLDERNASITRYRMDMFAFPVRLCAPQRQRQPGHEWLLDQPARFISDLAGSYMEQAFANTRETVDTWRKGISTEPPKQFESEAWHACQDSCDAEISAFWAAREPETDALASARQRKLHAVLLADPMYRMRHLASRIDNLQELLKDCTRLATEHPHHASALLLHNLAVPSRIGGGLNPMSQSLRNKLNDDGKREINIATAAIERAHVRKLLENAQQALAAALELGQHQQCIADHLSLDGFDYQAAMFFAVRLLASIATPAAQLDPLAFNGDIHDAVTGLSLHRSGRSSAQRLLTNIANNNRHPLHVMLWPEIKDEQLFALYQAPDDEEPNKGDGRFRATALASLENKDAGDPNTETLDGITLAALMESGTLQDSFTVQLGVKHGMTVLSRINEILHGAVQAAENRIIELANQTIDSRQTQQQTATNNARQNQIRPRSTLDAQANGVNIRLHGMQGEHLRQTMPRTFDNARFIRAGNVSHANIRDYYLFGLEDLPEVDPNAAAARIYGEYRDDSGRLLGITNARSARKSGTPIVPDSGTYFAVPANSQTASVLKQLNQAINSEALASSALVAAQNEARQLKAPLQLATENLKRAREGVGYRALNSKPFSVMVVMMEAWNLQVAMNEVQRIALERGSSRLFFGTVSIAADLLIALEALASKVVGNQLPLLSLAQKEIIKIPNEMAVKLLGARLAKHIVSVVTIRMLGQVSAGLLFAGVSLSDAFHASRWSDSSVWGHYMVATGGLLSASAVLLAGSAILTPVALLAVALIIGGAFIVAIFSNTDFEDWLAGSVFSEEGGINKAMRNAAELLPFMNGSSHYLEEPDEAFYRLVGLFSGISIQIERNPHHDPKVRIGTYSSADELMKRANTRITVSSNIMGLTAQLGKPDNMVRCCLVRKEISTTPTPQGFSHQSRLRFLPDQSEPLISHTIGETVSIYVNTPANTRQNSQGYQLFDEYHWEVRAQIQLKDDNKNTIWAFPAPGPKVPPVNSSQHTEPNFKKTKQILWADQESHGVTGTRI